MILKNGKRIDGASIDTAPIGILSPYLGTVAPEGYLLCQGQKVSKTRYKQLYNICKSLFGTETNTEFYLPDLRGKTITGYKEGDSTFGTLGGLIGNLTHAHSISHTHGVPGVAHTHTSAAHTHTVASHTHTTGNHTLTVAEMPSHNHGLNEPFYKFSELNMGLVGQVYKGDKKQDNTWYSEKTGGGQAHNHGNTGGTSLTTNSTTPGATGSTTPAATTTNSQSTSTSGSGSTLQPSMNLNWIVKAEMINYTSATVYNGLDSDSTTNALSAKQGKVLNEKFENYLPLHGTADKAATVGNLVIRSKSMSWGTLIEQNGYTIVNAWDSPADGGIVLSDKDKRLSIQIDGYFYQQEGQYRVLDTSDLGNYAFYKWPSGSIILSKSGTTSISKELTITTKGRPVYISVSGDNNPTTDSAWFNIYFYRDNKMISQQIVESHGSSWNIPFSMQYLDTVDAGSHTYKVEFAIGAGSTDLNESRAVQSPNFTVFEI